MVRAIIVEVILLESEHFENTKQLILPLPTYPNAMRLHFDQKRIIRELDFRNNDYDIVSNDKLQTYLGVQGPLQVVNTDNSDLKGPTVDGDENTPQRLFMLANNKASLNCCDSSNMSTSNGCISCGKSDLPSAFSVISIPMPAGSPNAMTT